MSKDYTFGIGAVLFAAFLWGTTGTAAALAPQVNPIAIGSAAMGFGGLLQAIIARKQIFASASALKIRWQLVLIGAISVMIYPLAFYASMRFAGITTGTVISLGSAPLASMMLERIFDKNAISRQWLIGLFVALSGMVLLSIAKNHHSTSSAAHTIPMLGILLGLIAGLSYAIYSWTIRHVIQYGIPSAAAMGATFGIGGLLLMPILFMTGSAFLWSWQNFAVGAYMALIPMFLGYVCFGLGLARISASLAVMLTLFEPVVAASFAVVFIGERLPVNGWIGVALILLSLIFITLPLGKLKAKTKT